MVNYEIIQGDCIQTMKGLPAGSVQTCVTSPPYYGLRSYIPDGHDDKVLEIGLEETPEMYVAKLVDVFREVRRLLRDDGTLWLNLGSSYNGSGGAGGDYGAGGLKEGQPKYPGRNLSNFKPKDMIPIPWMVAMALQQDGYYLRSDIIWSKPNPMPESVTDRPTKAHEYIFLLSKSAQYFYDADAVREPYTEAVGGRVIGRGVHGSSQARGNDLSNIGGFPQTNDGRNRRSVWTVTTKPYSGAHFATFPPDLIEPCILAGTSAHGACSKCGAPWARIVERGENMSPIYGDKSHEGQEKYLDDVRKKSGASWAKWKAEHPDIDKGWQPTCTCAADVVPQTVLDPFNGSGTTGAVALKHGRKYIGCELNPDYIELAHDRIRRSQPMLLEVTA